jgi:hypothetical protein
MRKQKQKQYDINKNNQGILIPFHVLEKNSANKNKDN